MVWILPAARQRQQPRSQGPETGSGYENQMFELEVTERIRNDSLRSGKEAIRVNIHKIATQYKAETKSSREAQPRCCNAENLIAANAQLGEHDERT